MTRLEALSLIGIKPDFTPQELKKAFREKAKKSHPDRSGNDDDFKMIKEAYELLRSLGSSPFMPPRSEPEKVNLDIELDLAVTFVESCVGCVKRVTFDRHELFTSIRSCGVCHGRGWLIREGRPTEKCGVCRSGRNPQKIVKSIRIPPGIATGNILTFRGEGNFLDKESGNLAAKVKVMPSRHLQRKNWDVIETKDVKYSDLLLGRSLIANTVHGDVKVEIPYGSFDGDSLRIKGRGIKTKNNAGNHIVKLRLVSPSKLNDDQREALENLRRTGL